MHKAYTFRESFKQTKGNPAFRAAFLLWYFSCGPVMALAIMALFTACMLCTNAIGASALYGAFYSQALALPVVTMDNPILMMALAFFAIYLSARLILSPVVLVAHALRLDLDRYGRSLWADFAITLVGYLIMTLLSHSQGDPEFAQEFAMYASSYSLFLAGSGALLVLPTLCRLLVNRMTPVEKRPLIEGIYSDKRAVGVEPAGLMRWTKWSALSSHSENKPYKW